jgi:hypothetical protein
MNRHQSVKRLYQIWIVRYRDWRPAGWRDVPHGAVALHSAIEGCFSARRATAFIRGFNETALMRGEPLWAICRRVRLRYDGEFAAGRAPRA